MISLERSRFCDLLADAALDATLWPSLMEILADLIGGRSAMLSRFNMRDGSGSVEIARIDPTAKDRYFAYYATRNPLSNVADPDGYLSRWSPRVLTDEDWMPKEDLLRSEYYNDFLVPQDMHSVVMIRLAAIVDDVAAVSITRPRRQGRFDEASLALARDLHPGLIRAYNVGQVLAESRAAATQLNDFIENARHALILVGGDGRVRRLNRAAALLLKTHDDLSIVGGRLMVRNRANNGRLHQIIGGALGRGEGTEWRDDARSGRWGGPFAVTVTPLATDRGQVFGAGAAAMITIIDPLSDVRIEDARLRDLFGLSPAEIGVVLALFKGDTLREAAARLGLSLNTVRNYLMRVFAKTGTKRQSELMRLLMNLADT